MIYLGDAKYTRDPSITRLPVDAVRHFTYITLDKARLLNESR